MPGSCTSFLLPQPARRTSLIPPDVRAPTAVPNCRLPPQMDYNDKEATWAQQKLELEKRITELEASYMEK